MNSLKAVIFDLDGTLIDAYEAVTESMNHAFDAIGYDQVTMDTVKRNVGGGERALISKFVRPEDVDKTLSVFRRHHRFALKSGVRFLPGAKELLKELKSRGIRIAVATNRPSRFTHIILKQLNYINHFDCVISADKVAEPKPAPDMLDFVIQSFAIQPHEALYIGDMAIDVQAGNRANIRTVAVTTGSNTHEEIVSDQPFAIVSSMTDMTEIIDRL